MFDKGTGSFQGFRVDISCPESWQSNITVTITALKELLPDRLVGDKNDSTADTSAKKTQRNELVMLRSQRRNEEERRERKQHCPSVVLK